MNTNVSTLKIMALLIGASLFRLAAPAQPGGNTRIDPATGLPARPAGQSGQVNPATGLFVPSAGLLTPETALNGAIATAREVHQLIFSGRYEEALQHLLTYHDQYKTSGGLMQLLPDWIELGRRFPRAKEKLIAIRDQDVREFSAGRGFADLFAEVSNINKYLQQDDATYALFKSFRDKDPNLAQKCYFYVEALLVARGEYQWCYDHMGDPQARFDSNHRVLSLQLENQKRLAELSQQARHRLAEINRQHGLTNAFNPPDTAALIKKSTENSFVSQTQQLIEILVATGHKAEAEKIRDQAVAILNDSRLQSAVTEAEAKIKQ